jgi:hypothetical protein
LFNIQKEICSSVSLYLEALSPESVPVPIIAAGVSQIHMLKPCMFDHASVDRDPHQFTFDNLINHTCNLSGNDHPA